MLVPQPPCGHKTKVSMVTTPAAAVQDLKGPHFVLWKPFSIVLVFAPVLLQGILVARELKAWTPVWA